MTQSDKNKTLSILYSFAIAWICFSCLIAEARGLQVTLAWDESPPEDRIRTYRLYYGNASRAYSSYERVNSGECSLGVCECSLQLTQGRWYFAVTSVNTDGLESGFSQEVFADLYAEPRLLYPSIGGTKWIRGCIHEIRWAGFESSHVSLELTGPSGTFSLSSSTPNDGLFSVRVRKKYPVGEGYVVRVEGKQLPQEWDESQESFSIVEPQVTAPQDRAVFSRGEELYVSWVPSTFCGDAVSLALHKGPRRIRFIGSQVHNTGEFSWTVPQDLESGAGYRVVVRSKTHGACRSSSPGGFVIQ